MIKQRIAGTFATIDTAHALTEERNKCLAAGMVEHVAKPIDLAVLLNAILKQLRPGSEAALAEVSGMAPLPARSTMDLINWPELERQYRGRSDFMLQLLATVVRSCESMPAQLRELAERRDFAALAAAAHGLKGMASGVVPASLRELAAALETQAKGGAEQVTATAKQLAAGLDELLEELHAHLTIMQAAADAAGGGIAVVDEKRLRGWLQELENLLEHDDTAAVECYANARVALRTAFGPAVDLLGRHIQGFDFENALAILRRMDETGGATP